MSHIIDNIIIEGLSDKAITRYNPSIQATINGATVLTVASNSLQIFTGTIAGQILRLPIASTLTNGWQYLFYNNSSQIITIQDAGSNQIIQIGAQQNVVFFLQSNATSNGIWISSLTSSIHYLSASTLAEFTQGATYLQTVGGGTLHITGPINLVANLTMDFTNVRVIADTSITNAVNFNGFVMTLVGTGCYFLNMRFRGEVTTLGVRSQLLFNTTSNTPNFIWFDNCIFKNCIGSVYPNVALSPSGVNIDLTAAGANFTNVVFENCNASQDWYVAGGSYPVGLCVRNCHGATNKYVFVTGHTGQTEGRNRFILAPLSGTPLAGTVQSFITDGSGVHNGPFEVPSIGTNTYAHALTKAAILNFITPVSGSVLSLEPDSPLNADSAFIVIDATTSAQSITMPPTPNYYNGAKITFHKKGTFPFTINQSSPDTVNGTTSYTCRGFECNIECTFRESTGDWYVQEFANSIIRTKFLTASNSTYILDGSTDTLLVAGSTLGQIISLGDATSYDIGKSFTIQNDGGYGMDITLNSGSVIERILPLESITFYLQDNSTANGTWRSTTVLDKVNDPDFYVSILDDWISGVVASNLGWTTTSNGTGAAAALNTANIAASNPGLVQLDTGTTTTGRCSLTLGTSILTVGGGFISVDVQLLIPILSVVAQEYIIRVGFGDTTGAGDMVDGIYFEYNRLISTNWILKTASNSTRTQVISSIAVGTVFTDLAFEINDSATRVDFFIDGVSAGTIATNIPTGTARAFGPLLKIEKSAGTTTRQLIVDYYKAMQVFSVPR
jgi:hypothetical protein